MVKYHTFALTVLATLSIRTAYQGESFNFIQINTERVLYDKKPISITEQVDQLKKRGLIFENEDFASKCLSHISYYRLAGYWWSMQEDKEKHYFKPNSTFENVMNIYNFDAELRLLLFDVIEKIEISLRTKLIYHLSHDHDPWWFQNTELFRNTPALVNSLNKMRDEVDRSKDIFIKDHKKKYKNDLRFPPAWKTLELSSLGGLSKLYGNLKNNINAKDRIAKEFGAVNHTFLPSWLQSIAQIRNLCAHHSRLWNKNLPGTVKLLPKPPNKWIENIPKPHEFQRLYIHLSIMRYLLNTIIPNNDFSNRLCQLLSKYNNIDSKALGFKDNWMGEALWR